MQYSARLNTTVGRELASKNRFGNSYRYHIDEKKDNAFFFFFFFLGGGGSTAYSDLHYYDETNL